MRGIECAFRVVVEHAHGADGGVCGCGSGGVVEFRSKCLLQCLGRRRLVGSARKIAWQLVNQGQACGDGPVGEGTAVGVYCVGQFVQGDQNLQQVALCLVRRWQCVRPSLCCQQCRVSGARAQGHFDTAFVQAVGVGFSGGVQKVLVGGGVIAALDTEFAQQDFVNKCAGHC